MPGYDINPCMFSIIKRYTFKISFYFVGLCLNVVSSCVLLCRSVRELSYQNTNIALRERVAKTSESVSRSASALLQIFQTEDNSLFRRT